jgi:hypothetical protein
MRPDTARELYNIAAQRRQAWPPPDQTEGYCWLHIALVAFEDCAELRLLHPDAIKELAAEIRQRCCSSDDPHALVSRVALLLEAAERQRTRHHAP